MSTVRISGIDKDGRTRRIQCSIHEERSRVSMNISKTDLASLDLNPLSRIAGLQELRIYANDSLKELDLRALGEITTLRRLKIYANNSLTSLDLSPLASLTDLQNLTISDNYNLVNLDTSPLSSLIGLEKLIIRGLRSLKNLDLFALSKLTGLQVLDLGNNKELTHLDLNPLFGLIGLQKLEIYGNHRLTSLSLDSLGNMTGLQRLLIWNNKELKTLEFFLSLNTIDTVAPSIAEQIKSIPNPVVTFSFAPIRHFQHIAHLLPIVQEYEEPWKMHHLIQSALTLLGLECIGMLEIDYESFASIMHQCEAPQFKEMACSKFISYWIEQIESEKTTIGIPIARAREFPELALRIDRIIGLRTQEIEQIHLTVNSGIVDLKPLLLTAYGFDILKTLGLGIDCLSNEIKPVIDRLMEIGADLRLTSLVKPEVRSNMSDGLKKYIYALAEHWTCKTQV